MTMKRNCVNKPLNSKKQPRVIANLQLETLRLGLSDLQFRRTVLASRHVVMLKKARQYWRWRPVCRFVIGKPKSEVQSPKVKTERTWADTKITWATTPPHPTTP